MRRFELTLEQFIYLTDPDEEGRCWINICNCFGDMQYKINSISKIKKDLGNLKVKKIYAADINEFDVWVEE